MSENKKLPGSRHSRSRLLYEITGLLIVVILILGIAVFATVQGTLNNMINKDKQDRIDSDSRIIMSSSQYIFNLLLVDMLKSYANYDIQDTYDALMEKRLSGLQIYLNGKMNELVSQQVLGLECIMMINPHADESASQPFPYITACNDAGLVYAEVPAAIPQALLEGKAYFYEEEGIPELGFTEETLVIGETFKNPFSGYELGLLALRPMHEEISHINSFYQSEKNKLTWILALIVIVGMLLIMIVSFYILRVLIKRRITKPIDELAEVAGEVVEGNLGVDIKVRKGEEFEVLKVAFREMILSLRDIIGRSTQD